jgi:hypothetical protein
MTFDPHFGRLEQTADYRDWHLARFITPLVERKAARTVSKHWDAARVLDQGNTNHCVGFSFALFGIALPVFQDWYADMGHKIYYSAKVIDGNPTGEDGTYTRSGIQAFMQYSRIKDSGYAWAGSADEVAMWVLAQGPVSTGTRWYSSMMTPSAAGLVTVGGSVVGGHEWLIVGYDSTTQLFHAVNSWGTGYGVSGHFYISFLDYARLLRESGDAVTAVEVAAEPAPASHRWRVTKDAGGGEQTIVDVTA